MWILESCSGGATVVSDKPLFSRPTGTIPNFAPRACEFIFTWHGWTGTSDYYVVVVDRLATASTTSLTLERHIWVWLSAHEHQTD